ncbi:MAG TPA: carbamoyl-phosphate synthase domain-containing protein, partial [Microthrixaceae bacterium]|nr:carbamoyl-phosphate synthase domain-containing protein [Microthrixaceae bacterium]
MSRGIEEAAIVLADGTLFEGEAIGARPEGGVTPGEFVFNTVLSGYQEVISDPSYAGQVITFTYPHIGNYGVNAHDDESVRPHCSGVVVRELARRHSNHRAEGDLDSYLRGFGVAGIAGVDTRRLTRHLRDHGAMPGVFGSADEATLRSAASAAVGTDGRDLVAEVTAAGVASHAATGGA